MAVGEGIIAIFYFIDHHVHDLNQEGQQRLFFIFPFDIGKAYVLDVIEGVGQSEQCTLFADKRCNTLFQTNRFVPNAFEFRF